ncbi:MAG: hypothetical protein ABI725_01140 [Chloroflexota bacterium]
MEPDDQPFAPSEDDSDAPVRLDENASSRANGHLPEGMTADGDLHAESVNISQGGARDIQATTVSITQGGAAQVHAESMSLSQGGVAMARTENFSVNQGGSAFAVVSDKATVNEGGNVLVLVAGEVNGDGRPLLDWRSALALAVGLAVAWRLLRRIF